MEDLGFPETENKSAPPPKENHLARAVSFTIIKKQPCPRTVVNRAAQP